MNKQPKPATKPLTKEEREDMRKKFIEGNKSKPYSEYTKEEKEELRKKLRLYRRSKHEQETSGLKLYNREIRCVQFLGKKCNRKFKNYDEFQDAMELEMCGPAVPEISNDDLKKDVKQDVKQSKLPPLKRVTRA